MADVNIEKIVETRTRLGTLEALTDELETLNSKTITEDELQIYFTSVKKWDNECYRVFIVEWGLPFDRAAPRWCGGENNSTIEPSTKSVSLYLTSLKRIFMKRTKQLNQQLELLTA